MPTTLGSVLFKDYVPERDSFVAAKLKQAGAIVLAKVTFGELGGGDTYGSLFGATRNPIDDTSLEEYLGRNASSPFKTHAELYTPENVAKLRVFPKKDCRWA